MSEIYTGHMNDETGKLIAHLVHYEFDDSVIVKWLNGTVSLCPNFKEFKDKYVNNDNYELLKKKYNPKSINELRAACKKLLDVCKTI